MWRKYKTYSWWESYPTPSEKSEGNQSKLLTVRRLVDPSLLRLTWSLFIRRFVIHVMSPNALDQSKTFKVCCQNMSSAFSAVKCDVTTYVTEESVHCRLSNIQYYKRAVNTSWWVHDNTLLAICQNLWSTSRRERHPSVCEQHMFVSSMLAKRQFPCILVQVAYLSFYRVQYI